MIRSNRRRIASSRGALLFLLGAISCDKGEVPASRSNAGGGAPAESGARAGAAATPYAFADVTDEAGIRFTHVNGASGRRHLPETMGGSAAWIDYDDDSDFDLFFGQSGGLADDPTPYAGAKNALYRNDGAGAFTDVTADGGAIATTGYGQGAAVGDANGDGRSDLYVTNYGPNVLLRNAGAKFEDVSAEAGVADPAWSCSAAFLDYDADGDLDLYVCNYVQFGLTDWKKLGPGVTGYPAYPHPDNFRAARDTLYRNRGDGTYEDATIVAGIVDVDGKGLGVAPNDLDGDGDIDLYVANDSTPNFTFRNDGGKFVNCTEESNAGYNRDGVTEAGMGVAVSDANNDALPEIFVTNLDSETNTLYVNQGRVTFEDMTDLAGLAQPSLGFVGFGVGFLDLDCDGDDDLLIGNGHIIDNIDKARPGSGITYAQRCLLHVNDGRGRFRNIVNELPSALAVPRVVRALALCDYDSDGDLDVALGQNNARGVLLRNDATRLGHFLSILPRDSKGRIALGVAAEVTTGASKRVVFSHSSGSYCAAGDPRLTFGLAAERADVINLRWPTGESLRLEAVDADQFLVVEPRGIVERRPAR